MLTNKNIEKLCFVIISLCLALAVFAFNFEKFGISQAVQANYYANTFFGELDVKSIEIIVDQSKWDEMLLNASDKEYISCTVVIDGETFTNVAIRPKGNSSLQQVQSSDSDRYSFKIEFDHYDSTKSYHGLDKLALNNIIQDNTYMKDYMMYTLMSEFGVASPLVNYTSVSVNGENVGLYLAVEAIEEAFLQRNYGTNYGTAYKPETSSMAGGGEMAGGMMGGMGDMSQMLDRVPEDMLGMLENGDIDGLLEQIPDAMKDTLQQSGMLDALNEAFGNNQAQGGMQAGMQGQMGQMGEMPQGTEIPPTESLEQGTAQGGMQAGMQGQMGQMGEIPQGTEIPPTESLEQGTAQGGMQAGMQGQMGEMPQGTEIPPTESLEQGTVQGGMQAGMQGQMGQMGEMPQGTEIPPTESLEQGTAQGGMQAGMQGQMGGDRNQMGTTSTSGTISSAFGYDGDDVDSYAYIFDNAVTNISKNDKTRMISSIKQINEQENLDEVLDIEQMMRYFIVHNFALNFDSYTGGIMHNYYIYEDNGVLTMLPWDYNLSFASFQTSYSTEDLVNFPIDTPVSSGTVESRPLLSWIFSDEEYTELYHELFAEFIDEIFISGYFANLVNDIDATISSYVEDDPTKFCTFAEYEKGVDTFLEFAYLRAESISLQLYGVIPSTSEGQSQDSSNLVSASHIEVTDTGSENASRTTGTTGGMGQMGGTERPTDRTETGLTGDMAQGQTGAMGQMGETGQSQMGGMQAMGGQMDRNQFGSFDDVRNTVDNLNTNVLLYCSVGVLALGLIIIFGYKKRR